MWQEACLCGGGMGACGVCGEGEECKQVVCIVLECFLFSKMFFQLLDFVVLSS